jgi:uncharacterized protein (TIGR02246 family)
MRIQSAVAIAMILSLCVIAANHGQDRDKNAGTAKQGATKNTYTAGDGKTMSPEEKDVRENVERFEKLYNAHDIKGLVAMFTPRAEMIDDDGTVTKGREAIEELLTKTFKETPKASMEIDVDTVRVLSSDLVIEEGVTRSKDSPDDDEEVTTYVAIHAKLDGKWLLASVRDWGVPPAELTPHDHLEELAWLVGEWIEESDDSVVHSVCKWHDNDNFLMQEFNVRIGGQIAMSGTMRIGWDAVRKQFKSWVFDSYGGHVEGYWTRDNDQWIVKSQGATATGEAASATTIYRPVDAETVVWRSFDRVIDGESREDIEPVTLKRRPPAPIQ